ncbi:MAG: hypothetical protein VYB45_03565, partial [Pseudomonadota bacterium]|nr:hypothetical protein [Pseudomonadota bacterium]
VSAMELALMGGWSTKGERAGSGAFEFIRKGSGRMPGAAEAIFFARNLNLNCWMDRKKYASRRIGGSERRDAIFVSAVWVEPQRLG